jgi:hypothetical protein
VSTVTTYVTTDPDVVAAVREQKEQQAQWLAAAQKAIAALPWSTGEFSVNGMFGPLSVGVVVASDIAAARSVGWKVARNDTWMTPMRGARGQTARGFLGSLGSCPTVASVIGAHGAPEYTSQPGPGMTESIVGVRAHVIGDAVHIEYPVEPTDKNVSRFASNHRGAPDPTVWSREPLSAYYAAREAADGIES